MAPALTRADDEPVRADTEEGPPIGTRPMFSQRFVVGYTVVVVTIGVLGFVGITWAMWFS